MKKFFYLSLVLFFFSSLFFLFYVDISEEFENNKIVEVNLSKETKTLLIGSFNIQVFGESKMSKPVVVANIVSILSRYDIVLIQEIRDKNGEAIVKLLHQLNINTGRAYDMVISGRLGNSASKEQYAFFYRKDKVHVENVYQFDDPKNIYEREPYSVSFMSGNKDFVLVGVHIDPDKVYGELSYLDDVLKIISESFLDKDIILMGDLNADCNYLSQTELEKIDLYHEYIWLIGSEEDTTVSKTDCAYDRIIIPFELNQSVSNARVYRFDLDLKLDIPHTKQVSDHYPVEFMLNFGFLLPKLCLGFFII